MLASLSIRNIVLIDQLDLGFDGGLCVLTGETGAGKSILLDALGLALGNRAEQRLLRAGSDRATVTATFDVPRGHPALALLEDQGIDDEDGCLLLRRSLAADGRSRAFINDQPVSLNLLRGLGDVLIEVQGQFDQRGLLDAATHRGLLDAFGGLEAEAARIATLWRDWRDALAARREAEARLSQARSDEAFLRHAVEELDSLAPRPGEESALAEQRGLLMNRDKLIGALNEARAELAESGRGGAEGALARAQRLLERAGEGAASRFAPALTALERAIAETEDCIAQLNRLATGLDLDGGDLEAIEDRYFALKDLARKHGVEADALATLRDDYAQRLDNLDSGAERIEALTRAAAQARDDFLGSAEDLSNARQDSAEGLDAAVNAELPPLKLEKARFQTQVERLDEEAWGPHGLDRVGFQVATNPGSAPGPLGRIASGGELSRFLLALKVVLAAVGPDRSLVFDEVDSGIGGATAHAVGERLERLARDRQIIVVTHSPQVAARGAHHWRVSKQERDAATTATHVGQLSSEERREELARMLSGAEVTDEARAAADRLIGTA